MFPSKPTSSTSPYTTSSIFPLMPFSSLNPISTSPYPTNNNTPPQLSSPSTASNSTAPVSNASTFTPLIMTDSTSYLHVQSITFLPGQAPDSSNIVSEPTSSLLTSLTNSSSSPTSSSTSFESPNLPFLHPQNTHPIAIRRKRGIVQPRLHPTLLLI